MLYFFLEVVCSMFHLVFMILYLKYVLCKLSVGSKVLCILIKLVCLGISLITTQDGLYHTWKAVRCLFMWHNSFFALFNHWMYYIHKFRKKDACNLNTSTLLQCSVSASWHHGRIQISRIFVPYHVSQEPFGAWRWFLRSSPCSGWDDWSVTREPLPQHWAPQQGGMLSPAPAALMDLNLYSQGHPHLLLFTAKLLCCYYFFLQVQELFVLLGTAAVLCCLTEVSKIIIFLLLWFFLAWIWPFFHTLLGFWCHLSNLLF